MSLERFAKIPLWLLARGDVSDGAKLVYARLRLFADSDGIAYPAQETLAREVGKSRRAVQYLLENLEAGGLIVSRRGQRGCRYTFPEPPMEPLPDAQPASHQAGGPDAQSTSQRANPDAQRIAQQETSRCATHGVLMRNLAYPDAQPASHNKTLRKDFKKRDPSVNQSIGSSETAPATEPEGPIEERSWFDDSQITTWRTRFRDARGELPGIAEVTRFLGTFASADEANAYFEHRWPSTKHRELKYVVGYRTDAETWLKSYRQDVSEGRTALYAEPEPEPELDIESRSERRKRLQAEAEIQLAISRKMELQKSQAQLKAWMERAQAGDLQAKFWLHFNQTGKTLAELSTEASRFAFSNGVLVVSADGVDRATLDDAVLTVAATAIGLNFDRIEREPLSKSEVAA